MHPLMRKISNAESASQPACRQHCLTLTGGICPSKRLAFWSASTSFASTSSCLRVASSAVSSTRQYRTLKELKGTWLDREGKESMAAGVERAVMALQEAGTGAWRRARWVRPPRTFYRLCLGAEPTQAGQQTMPLGAQRRPIAGHRPQARPAQHLQHCCCCSLLLAPTGGYLEVSASPIVLGYPAGRFHKVPPRRSPAGAAGF